MAGRLTGGLGDALELLYSSSQRNGRGYRLALWDVDQFKDHNDSFGHQTGDDALRAVAVTLARDARDADRVYRYGGEEFLLLLPEQYQDGAVRALDRVRHAVQDLRIPHPAGGPGGVLTVSIGVALRRSSRLIVDGDRPSRRAISRTLTWLCSTATSSRSAIDK